MVRCRFWLAVALVSVAGAAIVVKQAFAQDSQQCCKPPYVDNGTPPGACQCNIGWFDSECEDVPGNTCSSSSNRHQSGHHGICAPATSGSCTGNSGVTTVTTQSGDWSCYSLANGDCATAADCECRFVLDWDWNDNDTAVTVNVCSGSTCP